MKLVRVKMEETGLKFEEEFEVPDNEIPENYIENILLRFNDGRDEKYIRTIISISEPIHKEEVYDWEAVMKDCGKFYNYAQRQFNNAYGNRGIKEDYKKIQGAYSKFTRGIYGNFCELVREHGRSAYDDMTLLGSITKEQYKQLIKNYKNRNKND